MGRKVLGLSGLIALPVLLISIQQSTEKKTPKIKLDET